MLNLVIIMMKKTSLKEKRVMSKEDKAWNKSQKMKWNKSSKVLKITVTTTTIIL